MTEYRTIAVAVPVMASPELDAKVARFMRLVGEEAAEVFDRADSHDPHDGEWILGYLRDWCLKPDAPTTLGRDHARKSTGTIACPYPTATPEAEEYTKAYYREREVIDVAANLKWTS